MNLHEPAETKTMVLSSLTKGVQRPKKKTSILRQTREETSRLDGDCRAVQMAQSWVSFK